MTTINWKKLQASNDTNQYWAGLACTPDGQTIYAVDSIQHNQIYVSNNAGATWSLTNFTSMPVQYYGMVDCSDDGTRLCILSSSGSAMYIVNNGSYVYSANLSYGHPKGVIVGKSGLNMMIGGQFNSYCVNISTNGGMNWDVQAINGTNLNFDTQSIAMTDDSLSTFTYFVGGYFFNGYPAGGGGGLWKRTNHDAYNTWTNITPTGLDSSYNHWTVQVSKDSSNLIAMAHVSGDTWVIYKSVDLGNNWTLLPLSFNLGIYTINISDDGSKIILRTQGTNRTIYSSVDRGTTWSSYVPPVINVNTNCYTLSSTINSDATKVFLGMAWDSVYLSQNYAQTWTQIPPTVSSFSFPYSGVASNQSGSTVVASINSSDSYIGPRNNYVYKTQDFGKTWSIAQPFGENPDARPLFDVSVSLTGDSMAAIYNPGRVFTSNDAGTTWTQHAVSQSVDKKWQNCSNIYHGKFLVSELGGRLYLVNVDSAYYTEVQPAGNINKEWMEAQYAEDGQHMIAVAAGGRVYFSSNVGVTWSETRPSGDSNYNWICCAISSTGKYMIAGQTNGRIYISKDTGSTWSELVPSVVAPTLTVPAVPYNYNWEHIYISDNGDTIFASGYSTAASPTYDKWYSKDYGVTWETVTGAGSSDAAKIIGNKNGLKLFSADNTYLYQGDVTNVKTGAFLQDIIF